MTEYVVRFLNMLVAALLAPAQRLAGLVAARYEITQYKEAYEEARALEASGEPELAELLRAGIKQSIDTALTAGPAPQPVLSDDGKNRPFALEPPRPGDSAPSTDQPLSPPEGQGTPPPPRRRGRPSKKVKASKQQAAPLSNPTPTPVPGPNHP